MNMQQQKKCIGVSILSIFFTVCPLLPRYGTRLNAFCEKYALGLQLRPYWCISISDILAIYSGNVLSFEDAWYAKLSFRERIIEMLCFWMPGWKISKPLSIFMYGTRKQREARLRYMRIRFDIAVPIETMNKQGESICLKPRYYNWLETIDKSASGTKMCLNTWLIRGETLTTFNQITALARAQNLVANQDFSDCKLIQVETGSRCELKDFIDYKGRRTVLKELLEILLPKEQESAIPIIINLFPCKIAVLLIVRDEIEKLASIQDGSYRNAIVVTYRFSDNVTQIFGETHYE